MLCSNLHSANERKAARKTWQSRSFPIRYFKITTKIVLNLVLCFCKDIPVVTVINHKQSFSLSRKYSNIHEEECLRTLAFASTAFLHNKIKLHFVTFYRSHCHFHHSIMYSVNKAIKDDIIHSNFSTRQESLNVTSDIGFSGTVFWRIHIGGLQFSRCTLKRDWFHCQHCFDIGVAQQFQLPRNFFRVWSLENIRKFR